ncbi:MAG TPA: hypothetical protein VF458_17765 [Ktedonobacteraceae bacterium]
MNPTIALFDAETIGQLPWPETADGAYARSYLAPLIEQGSMSFVSNVKTTCMALLIDERVVLPMTINEREHANSYVCSPYAHYVTYALEELVLIKPAWLRRVLAVLIHVFGWLCRICRINQVIHVNNWLLSTNLYPELTAEQMEAVLTFLRARFPRHAILFRSLNRYSNSPLTDALRAAGCTLVPSRQVYFVYPSDAVIMRAKARWLIKRDFALLGRQDYSVVTAPELTEADIPRLVALYNMLYLDKYSKKNPMFTEQFLRLALQQQTLHLVALKKEGRIDAVLGYFCRNGVMTTPVFGYDMNLPQNVGLYRMLSAVLFHIAEEKKHLLHSSSGAAEFKRNRGAVAAIEYSAVYNRHLPLYRRLCWIVLSALLENVGVPLLKKYKL